MIDSDLVVLGLPNCPGGEVFVLKVRVDSEGRTEGGGLGVDGIVVEVKKG